MKKTTIYIIMFLYNSMYVIFAQEYKYFDIAYSNEYRLQFSPKDLTYSDINKDGTGVGAQGYQVRYNQPFYETFALIFIEVFGHSYPDDKGLFSKVNLVFYLRKDFKPYYFFVSYPADRKDEFPELEEKIYNFGKKCMQANIRAFIEVWSEDKFQGSTFEISLGSMRAFAEGKMPLEILNRKH